MPGLPDAELPDQSWMNPEPKRSTLPKAEYSDFNPPPDPPLSPEKREELVRQVQKSLFGIAIGIALLALSLYLFLT